MDADVIVIGLGAAGSWAAWRAAQQGARVIGLESRSRLHDDGAYAGESRLFRAAYHEGAHYVPMLLSSRESWLDLELGGCSRIFHDTGVLSIGSPDAPQLEQVRASLAGSGIDHEVLDADEIRARYPQHGLITDEIGVLDRLGGVLRPESAVAEIQRRALEAGAELRDHTDVVAIDETASGVTVTTADGTIDAAQVIVTAGAWTSALLPDLGALLEIKPLALTWFAPDDPRSFDAAVFPAFIRDHGETHLFGVPTLDGSLVKVGYDAKWESVDEPDALVRRMTLEQRDRVARDVHRLVPTLPAAVSRGSVHMDVFTADKTALLGRLSERVVVGTGFSGHGFKLTPAFGDALADLALDREPRFDLAPFAPSRFATAPVAA